jgi:hypothetical protein
VQPERATLRVQRLADDAVLEPRFEVPGSDRWTALVSLEIEGVPHVLAYRSDTGSSRSYRLDGDRRLREVAHARWESGWNVFMPFRLGNETQLLRYNQERGFASYMRWERGSLEAAGLLGEPAGLHP